MNRAYEVSAPGFQPRTIFAATAGNAKYQFLLDNREIDEELTFANLKSRALGMIAKPLSPAETAQQEADDFNAAHPIGTLLRYWSWTKEGPPTGVAPIKSKATVMCEHAVIWLEGVRSCHSISHVEREQ
jgi:hypothetical protein